jgi:mRNA interferase MazF
MTRGVIVLTPFPFADLSSVKKRPALVVSSSHRAGNEIILAFIGTYKGHRLRADDLLLHNGAIAFVQSGLKVDSFVRLGKLLTVIDTILLGEIGQLPDELMLEIDEKLRHMLAL